MSLKDLTSPAVERAISEFEKVGRDAFLKKYKFRPARGYFIVRHKRRYDSKAIAGAAHQFLGRGSKPLSPQTFSGGESTVARVLRSLGFEVEGPSSVDGRLVPFERGDIYSRRRHIHQRYGGQERGGKGRLKGARENLARSRSEGHEANEAD